MRKVTLWPLAFAGLLWLASCSGAEAYVAPPVCTPDASTRRRGSRQPVVP